MLQKIFFVKESEEEKEKQNNIRNDDLDGNEVSEEYRKIVENNSKDEEINLNEAVSKKTLKKTSKQSSTREKALKPEDIFNICQGGDLRLLEKWLKCDGFDLNKCDQFGWTPLMIACCGGRLDVVRTLLDHGANLNCFCPSGRSLIKLCEKFKQFSVIRFLESYTKKTKTPETESNSVNNVPETGSSFDCEFCGIIVGTTLRKHRMSITHQLASRASSSNSDSTSQGSFAHVSNKYKGYQMLKQQGWNGISGLGAKEDGRKYPIPVKVRQDRTAIGHSEGVETKIEKFVNSQTLSSTPSSSSSDERIAKPKLKHKLANRDKKDRKIAMKFRTSFYES